MDDPEVIDKKHSSEEISHSVASKSSKRYSDRRREDKIRKEVPDPKPDSRNEASSNGKLDQMSTDLSNRLHLEDDRVDQEVQLNDKQTERRDKDKRKQIRERDNDQGEKETRELEMDKRKNKVRCLM